MIVVGDIGGTKVDLALCEEKGNQLQCISKQRFQTHVYEDLIAVLKDYLSGKTFQGARACFGVAVPILNGESHLSNIHWVINAKKIKDEFHFIDTWLINDLEAIAYGVGALTEQDFITLNSGHSTEGSNSAIIAAGTGLGEAGLYWNGNTHCPFASEGGHCSYAPRTELEINLLRYLAKRFGDVSYERIVSGQGIENIYQFLRDTNQAEEPKWLKDEMEEKDPPAVISKYALTNTSEICIQALDLFISNYGSEAGNLTLKYLARNGIFLGGGIAPKIIDKLKEGLFMKAFTAKGRFRDMLSDVPVKVINNKDTSLLGAARYALLKRPN
jgi:glucokinase